ncbi:DUF3631 domain-containing protein [Streptomyces sp. CBMA123]|uniref:DUF3631 domain-containing protein n=1 Tax=Streptomyces sp. CBMA123 TaxID=1896313 RepID=UPI001661990F|nr:DUF3631 domain-containing protein [Streptomyces sp. CBMA123]MBD0694711.1 hypothetical protein [Streptomyces sp. CBMA123]
MESTSHQPDPAATNASWPAVAKPGEPGSFLPGQQSKPVSTACGHATEAAPVEPAVPDGTDLIPDTEATEGADLLAQLRAQIAKFVILPSEQALDAATLWVAATHLQGSWQHAPRLAVVGPAKRCGKSRLLDVLTETVHQPVLTVNSTPAAVFRSITEEPPTLLVDEADTIFGSPKMAEKNEEMRGLLNAGHQRDRYVLRVVGNDHTPRRFHTFAMAAIAGIGDLPDTIMDRSIVIRMRRRAEGESVAPYRTKRDSPALHAIRDKIARWAAPLADRALCLEPSMPVEDRAADTWEPLVIVADLAGGPWPRRARQACRRMVDAEVQAEEDNPGGARILADIRRIFHAASEPEPDSMTTGQLLFALNGNEEAPWAESARGGLTPRALGAMLREFGIISGNVRLGDGTQRKGYTRHKFLDAWRRYCPTVHPVTLTATDESAGTGGRA